MEQKASTDTALSDQEALEILHGSVYHPLYHDALIMAQEALEERQWIPVDREKPPTGIKVIVCFADGFQMMGFWLDYDESEFGKDGEWSIIGEDEYDCESDPIVAWKHCSKSYKPSATKE